MTLSDDRQPAALDVLAGVVFIVSTCWPQFRQWTRKEKCVAIVVSHNSMFVGRIKEVVDTRIAVTGLGVLCLSSEWTSRRRVFRTERGDAQFSF